MRAARWFMILVLPISACAAAPRAASTHPPKTRAELQERMLRFLDGIHSSTDNTAARLAAVFGLTLTPKEIWLVSGYHPLKGDYEFYANITSLPGEEATTEIHVLPPHPQGERRSAVRAADPPCIWDAAEFSRKLQQVGYTTSPDDGYIPHGLRYQGGWDWAHSRLFPGGKKGAFVSLLTYLTGTDDALKECAYGIRVEVGEL